MFERRSNLMSKRCSVGISDGDVLPFFIGLCGRQLSFLATSLNFGAVVTGSSSSSQSVSMTNTGGSAMSITSVGVTGTNAPCLRFRRQLRIQPGSELTAPSTATSHDYVGRDGRRYDNRQRIRFTAIHCA